MKIGIVNIQMSNGGDAAIGLATAGMLREALGPETRFAFFDHRAEAVAPLYPELSIHRPLSRHIARPSRLRRLRPLVQRINTIRCRAALRLGRVGSALLWPDERGPLAELASCDAVISTGGTYLIEPYGLADKLLTLHAAADLGKPVILFTQSLGPFERPSSRAAMRRLLPRLTGALLRDPRSCANLESLGVPMPPVHVIADAAFGLAVPEAIAAAQRGALPTDRPLRVAVSVRHWPHFASVDAERGTERFRAAVRRLVEHITLHHGGEVEMLSTCQAVPGYTFHDPDEAEAVVEGLDPRAVARTRVNHDFHRPEALMRRIAGFDAVVATRMHMAILALATGVPAMPVAYEFKTRELYDRLGLAHWCGDIESDDAGDLVARFDAMLDDLPTRRAALFSRVAELRDEARSAGPLVAAMLGRQPADAPAAAGTPVRAAS